jgi:hypothetical protein
MTVLAGDRRTTGRHAAGGLMLLPLLAFFALAITALGYIVYALWPRWPDAPVASDAPALPIVVAGVLFNVPPQVIRVPLQRRSGAQERIDLAYLWPSLTPPDSAAAAAPNLAGRDRVFVTVAAAESLPPLDRLKTIYPRYTEAQPAASPQGLTIVAFRDGTPYQAEDLVFDAATPERFFARCSRTVNPLAPGTCLNERRIGDADLTVRFPRDWLESWQTVEAGIEKLIAQLRPAGG